MRELRIITLLVFIFIVFSQAFAQSFDVAGLVDYVEVEEPEHFTQFAAVLLEGEPLINKAANEGFLTVFPATSGKLSVASIDRSDEKNVVGERVGFRVGVLDWRTQTLWMFSDKVLYEVELAELIRECELGDRLIFMTVDRKYRLPRHEVTLIDGC